MSTILKALRRLEDERSVQTRRPLREEVAGGGAPGRSRGRGVWLLAGVLGLAVGVAAAGVAFLAASPDHEAAAPIASGTASGAAPAASPAASTPTVASRSELAVGPTLDETGMPLAESAPEIPPSSDEEAEAPHELSAAALASPVERLERPPREPRIADPDDEPEAADAALAARAVPLPASAMPGRHRPPLHEPQSVEPQGMMTALVPTAQKPVKKKPAPPPWQRTPQRSAAPPTPVAAEPEPAEPDPWEVARRSSPPSSVTEAARAPEPAPETESPEPPRRPADSGRAEVVHVAAATHAAEPAPPEPVPEKASEPAAEPAPEKFSRAEVPGVKVTKTFWHPDPAKRTALVSTDGGAPREVKEGDVLGPLVVSSIEPSGVVFVHDGVEMRRRVGE